MKRTVMFVHSHDTVGTAARVMRDGDVGFLPVCDESGKVVGTVTDRDITLRAVAARRPVGDPVSSIMSTDLVAVRPRDDIERAQKLMRRKHKSRILCLDEEGRLAGVISLSDVVDHDDDLRAGETLVQVAEREAPPPHPHAHSH